MNENIKFGDWEVADDGIVWVDDSFEYFIPKNRMCEEGGSERKNKFDWLIHIAEKTWMTWEDVTNLNSAFKYALDYYKIDVPENISWEETLREQKKVFDSKED